MLPSRNAPQNLLRSGEGFGGLTETTLLVQQEKTFLLPGAALPCLVLLPPALLSQCMGVSKEEHLT